MLARMEQFVDVLRDSRDQLAQVSAQVLSFCVHVEC